MTTRNSVALVILSSHQYELSTGPEICTQAESRFSSTLLAISSPSSLLSQVVVTIIGCIAQSFIFF
jgi:hypothetical protein